MHAFVDGVARTAEWLSLLLVALVLLWGWWVVVNVGLDSLQRWWWYRRHRVTRAERRRLRLLTSARRFPW